LTISKNSSSFDGKYVVKINFFIPIHEPLLLY
jgi:hypothetical protein